jgi:hypothetical protein
MLGRIVEFDSQVHPIHDFTGNADLITQDLNDLQAYVARVPSQ